MLTKPLAYAVVIFRTNSEHIFVMESDDYEQCFTRWDGLKNLWQESAKGLIPFVLTDPVVTAFSPSMIYEISIIPNTSISNSSNNSKMPNPYQQSGNAMYPGYDLMNR